MIKAKNIRDIERIINNKKIIDSKLLSDSFGIFCFKITTQDNISFVVKFYKNANNGFNAIKSETKNLNFFDKNNIEYFPKVEFENSDYLIISFINNDNQQPDEICKDLLNAIISIHSNNFNKFGFEFDTQIGGLRQKNSWNSNWVDFYKEERLGYIFNLINKTDPMDNFLNKKIEKLLNNLHNFIPEKPNSSLLHGDLWEGNILFNKKKFVGFIDPGTFFGHNELEIAYLTWFNPNFIKNGFLDRYSEIIKIDKNYKNYEPIYQLYYSMLNVYLWDRIYVNDVKELLDKIKI